jgi:hypothetical protein
MVLCGPLKAHEGGEKPSGSGCVVSRRGSWQDVANHSLITGLWPGRLGPYNRKLAHAWMFATDTAACACSWQPHDAWQAIGVTLLISAC